MVNAFEFAAGRFAVNDVAEFGNTGLQVIPVQNVAGLGQRRHLPLPQLSGSIGENFGVLLISTELVQHE